MYINIITAFAGTSAPVLSLSEQSPAAGSYGNNAANSTPSQELPEPPQKESNIIELNDEKLSNGSVSGDAIVPENLIDESVIIKVFDRSTNEVVEMTLHDYVICAVAGEMPATFELEALKAQAVAARTFTVSHLKSSCSSNAAAHVCTYHGCCQAFVSVDRMKKNWGAQFEEKLAKITAAVEQTDSLVMLYNDLPITVFYFSTSNGYTDACQDVFVKNLPYYKSVESPGEETASGYYSYVKLSYKEFADTLFSKLGIAVSENDIENSVSITRTDGGRVKSISFNGKSVKGTQIRTAFGLKSADFHLTFLEDYILIEVYGYGHGVGMSQLGANYMAKQGNTFCDILNHYYINVDIKSYM